MRTGPQQETRVTGLVPVEDVEEPFFDETPPPDHDDFVAVRANGLRAIGRRWEIRRRRKQESLARGEG